jgi:hypothetical protein
MGCRRSRAGHPAAPITYNPLNDPLLILAGSSRAAILGQWQTGWHTPNAAGDLYLRVSVDGGVTFGPAQADRRR